MRQVLASCRPGARILDLCRASDKHINDLCSKVYTKQQHMEKGVAFPTCISLNHIVEGYSPQDDGEKLDSVVRAGDLLKM